MRIIYRILFVVFCIITFVSVFSLSMIATLSEKWEETIRYLKVTDSNISGEIYKDLKYNDIDDCGYDLYLPVEKKRHRRYPLILFIHGGSFVAGDKKEGKDWCKYFSSKGCIAATVNYTLHNEKHTSDINRMHNDIKDCVQAIKNDCDSLGYTIDEMAVSGVSAGGCLAMLYAYREADDSPVPVKFVFQQSSPTNFHGKHWGFIENSASISFASLITGVEITDSMIAKGIHTKLLDSISPSCMVTRNSVPTICAYGPHDRIVPPGQKRLLIAALDSCNIPYHNIDFPNSGHTLANDPDSMAAFIRKTDEFCRLYFKTKRDATE